MYPNYLLFVESGRNIIPKIPKGKIRKKSIAYGEFVSTTSSPSMKMGWNDK